MVIASSQTSCRDDKQPSIGHAHIYTHLEVHVVERARTCPNTQHLHQMPSTGEHTETVHALCLVRTNDYAAESGALFEDEDGVLVTTFLLASASPGPTVVAGVRRGRGESLAGLDSHGRTERARGRGRREHVRGRALLESTPPHGQHIHPSLRTKLYARVGRDGRSEQDERGDFEEHVDFREYERLRLSPTVVPTTA